MLKEWRRAHGKTVDECARALGMEGGGRTFQRLESGENKPDADTIEAVVALTEGAVTPLDLHHVRLNWLRQNRPERMPIETPPISPASDDAARHALYFTDAQMILIRAIAANIDRHCSPQQAVVNLVFEHVRRKEGPVSALAQLARAVADRDGVPFDEVPAL